MYMQLIVNEKKIVLNHFKNVTVNYRRCIHIYSIRHVFSEHSSNSKSGLKENPEFLTHNYDFVLAFMCV